MKALYCGITILEYCVGAGPECGSNALQLATLGTGARRSAYFCAPLSPLPCRNVAFFRVWHTGSAEHMKSHQKPARSP